MTAKTAMAIRLDEQDAWLLTTYRWSIAHMGGRPYAITHVGTGIQRRTLYLARLVAGAKDGQLVDHANGDTLDNRRRNLRIADRRTNKQNQRRTHGSSRFKGVSWHARDRRWRAQIQIAGRKVMLGDFAVEADAAPAYDNAATEAFGEFAATNKELGFL